MGGYGRVGYWRVRRFLTWLRCSFLELGQADFLDAPVEAPATMVFALDLLGILTSVMAALMCLTLGFLLFWRRSDDWMVVFISSYLLLYGTMFAGPLEWAENFYTGGLR